MMKQLLENHTGVLMIVICLVTGLIIATNPRPSHRKLTRAQRDSVSVFLLERDLPREFERRGVVAITPPALTPADLAQWVNQQLQEECQKRGANGAFRVNEGTYPPYVIRYLVFKYDKP
ncbi:hypothetical protein [Larkinella arboricola]|nr:hypothetical protein [Larkinella arboricola]